MTDPIADMLTRIRNAIGAQKPDVLVPQSKMKVRIAEIFAREGFVLSVIPNVAPHTMRITLKYTNLEPAIRGIRRVSKPGRRVYAGATELPRVLSDLGIAVVSTSAGIMTNKEARRRKLGGEVLCEVY